VNRSSESVLFPDENRVKAGLNAGSSRNAVADASRVNRTHRVIRERAKTLKARRSRIRSLWIPLTVSSALLLIFCTAIWNVMDEYELVPTGIPDSRYQIFVLMLWFFPVSACLLGMVWYSRSRSRSEEDAT
jgi:hypothetical protein